MVLFFIRLAVTLISNKLSMIGIFVLKEEF